MAGRGRRYATGALGGVAVIGAAIGGLHAFQTAQVPTMTPTIAGASLPDCTTSGPTTTCTSPVTAATDGQPSAFRDGVYEAEGRYLTPGGAEAIGVRLTVSDGQVRGAQVRVEATSPTARQFQRQFASRYAPRVLSRDLASLHLTRVAGASLTSLGFDDALGQIQAAAREQA